MINNRQPIQATEYEKEITKYGKYRFFSENGKEILLECELGIPRSKNEMVRAVEIGYIIPAFRNRDVIDVDMLLDHVDLALKWYTPSIEALKFINFIRLCVGKEPENTNSINHYFLVDCIFKQDTVKPYYDVRNIDYEFLKGDTVILGTREFGKSIILMYLILYMAVTGNLPNFGKVHFILYVSDSMKGNVKTTMNTIESLYKNSTYLQSIFEEAKFYDDGFYVYRKPTSKQDIARYNRHIQLGGKIDTVPQRASRKFGVKGIGASGGRGARDDLQRPDGAIFDDLVRNDHDVQSDTIMSAIETTIEKDITGALSGNGSFKVLIGTAYAEHDPVYSRCKPISWLPCVFPKAEKPPTDDIPKDKFVSVWSDRHTYENQRKTYLKAKAELDNGKPLAMTSYLQEFFCRIAGNDDRLISDSCIKWFDIEYIKENWLEYTWIITTDFTTTGNTTSDDSGAFLWAIDYEDNWYLVDITLRKMHLEEQYKNLFRLCNYINNEYFRPLVGVEIDGQQSLHIVALRDRQEQYNTYLNFALQKTLNGKRPTYEGIRSSLEGGNKLWRFKLTRDRWYNGKIFLPKQFRHNPDMRTFLKEIKLTTNVAIKGTDNGIDCVSQLEMIDYVKPNKQMFNNVTTVTDKNGIDIWGRYKKQNNNNYSIIHNRYLPNID